MFIYKNQKKNVDPILTLMFYDTVGYTIVVYTGLHMFQMMGYMGSSSRWQILDECQIATTGPIYVTATSSNDLLNSTLETGVTGSCAGDKI